MRTREYIAKETLSKKHVVGLFALAIMGMAVVSYAAVNVPYVFSPGTPAKASETKACAHRGRLSGRSATT